MKYTTLTNAQLFLLAILTGLIAAGTLLVYRVYSDYRLLPQVHQTPSGECIKVVNFENGHAFGCPDVNVLLRRYRTTTTDK
jgi:hypothetical protein